MTGPMLLIPTTVCGSHGLPSWIHLVREAAQADRLGPIDLQEAYEDAVRLAIRDQVEAGVDVISDGEMRRVTFIRGFYDRLQGIRALPVPRRLGPPNYDAHCPYEVVDRISAPRGLGIVEEFRFARPHADRPGTATRMGRSLRFRGQPDRGPDLGGQRRDQGPGGRGLRLRPG